MVVKNDPFPSSIRPARPIGSRGILELTSGFRAVNTFGHHDRYEVKGLTLSAPYNTTPNGRSAIFATCYATSPPPPIKMRLLRKIIYTPTTKDGFLMKTNYLPPNGSTPGPPATSSTPLPAQNPLPRSNSPSLLLPPALQPTRPTTRTTHP